MTDINDIDSLYKNLHSEQLVAEEDINRHSAITIINIILEYFEPQSVLDIGCGLGTWLSVFQKLGIADIQGVDGLWLQDELLRVPQQYVKKVNLENPLHLNRRFDLAISLEVAEHIHQDYAVDFVRSLTRHASVILFSAAVPNQGGHGHINEQWLDYWITLFHGEGYLPLDFIRGQIWNDPSVLWWLRQNIIILVDEQLLNERPDLQVIASFPTPLSIIHPDVYAYRLQQAHGLIHQYENILHILRQGGTFQVTCSEQGVMDITHLNSRLQQP